MERDSLLPSVDRERIRRKGLAEFVRLAWHVVEPAAIYQHNWHIDLICDALAKAVASLDGARLVINVPPGTAKSLLVNVFFPAWAWSQDPTHRFIGASHDAKLVLRDALRCKSLVKSRWYQERWPDVQIDSRDDIQDTASLYYTTATGLRFSTTVGGKGVGWHAHTQLIDDPTKPAEAAGATSASLVSSRDWLQNTMSSRKVDPATAVQILIMQRIHHDDLAGLCIDEGWRHICLPMEYDPSHPHVCPDDPRIEPGELLWPERYPRGVVDALRTAMGPAVAAAQLDQYPSMPGGAVFHDDWLRKSWKHLPPNGRLISSWDHTFGSLKKSASYVVGQVWFVNGGDSYLVYQVRARMEFPAMIEALRTVKGLYPRCMTHLIENKASGPAIEQVLKDEITGIVMVSADASTGGKLARANSVTSLFAAGRVYLPEEAWVPGFRQRFSRFSGADADVSDEIDACTQALVYAHGTGAARFMHAMNAARRSA